MSKLDISIILPSFRVDNLQAVYDSILDATSRSFELVIVGPYYPPDFLLAKPEIKFVRDYGSPVRCSNIAASLCEGKYVTYVADDCVYLKDSIDKCLEMLENGLKTNKLYAVSGRYYEGKNGTEKRFQPREYYLINGAPCTASPYLPNSWYILNVGFMLRETFDSLGWWDVEFKATAMSHSDAACRFQAGGGIVELTDFAVLDANHDQQDHLVIEQQQLGNDEPLFQKRYRRPDWYQHLPISLDKNMWKASPSVWERFQ